MNALHVVSSENGKPSNRLSTVEKNTLIKNERIIERGLKVFYEVGAALIHIRDNRLYREHYTTFEEYCKGRWNLQRKRAYDLIAASEVIDNLSILSPLGDIPTNERQARPLTQLEPEAQRLAWEVVQQTAAGGKVTAAHVKSVVEVLKEVTRTHAIDDGTGEQVEVSQIFKAAVSEETYERMLRQQAHILNPKPKLNRAADEYVPQSFDACQTPAYALDPLLPYLKPEWTIWEAAAGQHRLVDALYDAGFDEQQVMISDLLTGQNFFEYVPTHWDCHITNPPYSLKYKWLEHCYQLRKPFALLLPVETLGAKAAQDLMQQYGFEMMLLDSRVDFDMPNKGFEGSAQFPVLWLCWQVLPEKVMFGSINEAKKAFKNEHR